MPSSRKKPHAAREEADLASLNDDDAREFIVSRMALDAVGGVLRIQGTRFTVLRPVVLVNIQKQLEQTVGASTKGLLYLAGERSAESGFDVSANLAGTARGEPLTIDTFQSIANVLALLGFGRFGIQSFNKGEDRIIVTLENSPFAEAYGPSAKPVCHMPAGYLAGIGRRLLAREILCEEIACKAQGKPRCEFELRSMPSL